MAGYCTSVRSRISTSRRRVKIQHKSARTASEESKAKEKESDRLRKKRCIQGESSGIGVGSKLEV